MKYSLIILIIFLSINNLIYCGENDEIDASIKKHLDRLRNGERLDWRAPAMMAFLNDGKIQNGLRKGAIEKIVKAIKNEYDGRIRSQAWEILLVLGRISDKENNGALLKDEEIIRAIINNRLRDRDGKELTILMTLSERVPEYILHKFDKELSSLLEEYPNHTLFQIIAKGKCYSAKPILEKLLQDERFQNEASRKHLEIALAALGDEKLENKFVNSYKNEKNLLEKAKYVKYLGWIGTEKSLRVLAEDFRTDIIYETKMKKRSLRIDIQYALIYNFPEEALLRKQIKSDEDYGSIEKFLEKKYGIKWKNDRPPFFTTIATHLFD
jgi:hypothetical protein